MTGPMREWADEFMCRTGVCAHMDPVDLEKATAGGYATADEVEVNLYLFGSERAVQDSVHFLRAMVQTAERCIGSFHTQQTTPLLITPPDLQRYVRAIFEWKLPQLTVVSFREIEPTATLRVIDRLGPSPAMEARGG